MGPFFMGEVDPSKDQVKEGLVEWNGWKMKQGKVLYFMQLFLHYIIFGENFIG